MSEESTFTVEFKVEKDTKRTRRYAEVRASVASPAVGTLYIQKRALDDAFEDRPDRVRITIEVVEDEQTQAA